MIKKKNCFNCKHFEHGMDALINFGEYSEFDGSFCEKRPDETEAFIHLFEYQNKSKQCFEGGVRCE